MEEFGSQVSSQLGRSTNSTSFVLLSRNIAFRVDRLNRNETVSQQHTFGLLSFFPPTSFDALSLTVKKWLRGGL